MQSLWRSRAARARRPCTQVPLRELKSLITYSAPSRAIMKCRRDKPSSSTCTSTGALRPTVTGASPISHCPAIGPSLPNKQRVAIFNSSREEGFGQIVTGPPLPLMSVKNRTKATVAHSLAAAIAPYPVRRNPHRNAPVRQFSLRGRIVRVGRSEEHTSELQSLRHLV